MNSHAGRMHGALVRLAIQNDCPAKLLGVGDDQPAP